MQRINWIDWAKTIAIITVIIGHMHFDGKSIFFQNLIYTFHMPIFFFISGFLFNSSGNFKDFTKKNVNSLITPYILLNLAVYLIFYFPNTSNSKHLLFSFITGESHAPAGPCWFLLALFFVRNIAYILLKLPTNIRIILLILLPSIAYIIKSEYGSFMYWGISTAFLAIIFFYFGYLIKKNNILNKFYDKNRLIVPLCIASTLLLIITTYFQGRMDIYSCLFGEYPILYYPTSFLGCFTIILFCIILNRAKVSLVNTISSGTLVILAFHGPLISYVLKILNRQGVENTGIFSNILVAIIIVLLLYYPILLIQKYFPILIGNRT